MKTQLDTEQTSNPGAYRSTRPLRWLAAALCLLLCARTLLPGATFTVTKATDSSPFNGTLRKAIEDANATTDLDTIVFSISGGGVKTISPLTRLPFITSPVTIDGWSQGGPGYTGPPLIEISGASCPPANGLEIYSGGNTIQGLIINRFAFAGIALVTNGNNTIQGNYIGTDATGTLARGNTNQGIVLVRSPNNLIGGTTPAARNVISGNRFTGIQLLNSGAHHNVIQGNYIGLDLNGTTALPNLHGGIVLNALGGTSGDYPADNTIGGSTAGARNVISGNSDAGILMAALEVGPVPGPTRNQILGNYIGTDKNGSTAKPNLGPGIYLTNATANVIGGLSADERNLISGNTADGIIIEAGCSNVVQGNFIGTDVAGTLPLGNLLGVTILNGSFNRIGGAVGNGNIIGGNSVDGIEIGRGGVGNQAVGNSIGLGQDGQTRVPNGGHGVAILDSTNNFVGAVAFAANYIVANSNNGVFIGRGALGTGSVGNVVKGNTIAENGADGLQISGGANGNQVRGNVVGAGPGFGGANYLGNGGHGVAILDSTNNLIGGSTKDDRNYISGNQSNGVHIGMGTLGTGSVSNLLRGNRIGTTPTGNRGVGVFVQGDWNSIGGTNAGEGNVIFSNGTTLLQRGHGVVIASGEHNPILGNLIWGNSGRGIDLGNDSFTVNDIRDGDSGTNDLQNYPVVTRVGFYPSYGFHNISWTLNSKTNRSYRIEYFANAAADASGFGEGQRLLGETIVITDAEGSVEFTNSFSLADQRVSATATDLQDWNTSEFSPVDTDGDAIADAWETRGFDFDEDGIIDLVLTNANPMHKDIYVEIDAMAGRAPNMNNLNRILTGSGQNDGFNNAPNELVQNPDLKNGITVHLERDQVNLPYASWTNLASLNLSNAFPLFDVLRSNYYGTISQQGNANALAAKKLVYRYCIFADEVDYAGGEARDLVASDLYLTLGAISSDPELDYVPSSLMHELGHLLGLHHGGYFDGINYKPNYHSIMNYLWNDSDRVSFPWRLDFSRHEFVTLNETDLDESIGIGGPEAHKSHRVVVGPIRMGTNELKTTFVLEFGPVDWNTNGNSMDLHVVRNLNFLCPTNDCEPGDEIPGHILLPREDWSKLRYYFLDNPDALPGRHRTQVTNDLSPDTMERLKNLGAGVGMFQFSSATYTLSETGGVALISVTRSFEEEGSVSVAFSAINGTATNGLDFVATNGTLNFTGVDAVKTFTVPILNDGVAEEPETVQLVLSNPTGGATLGARSQATLTIVDDDLPNRFTVGNTNNSGPGSLQQAILDANSATGLALIDFNIPATSGLTISLASPLDGITRPVTIDGTTQPGFAGVPIIELSGASLFNFDGLHISAGGCSVRGLVINGFRGNGIKLVNGGGNRIEGCYIGLNRLGTLDQGNAFAGVSVGSANNVIGGSTAAARNFISGNNGGGIGIGFTNNQVLGNVIGLGVDGSDQGNNSDGVSIGGSRNIVGGTTAGARNVISGNGGAGVSIVAGIESRVLGNYIGTDLTGAVTRSNTGNGITLNSPRQVIGGNEADAGNVISANGGWGISMDGTNSVILGNRIGTDAAGQTALPNQSGGIMIGGLNHQIGDTTQFGANTIAFNNGRGVAVAAFSGVVNHSIRGNSIFSNFSNSPFPDFSLGIDLGAQGITANDTNDTDVGANQLQNFPLLASATNSLAGTLITGSLNSRSNANFTIDFYASAKADPSGYGEGQSWIGSTNVTTDGSGNATFTATSPAIYLVGRYITATATDATGNTSEFSPAIFAASSLTGRTFTVENVNDSGPGSLRQAILDANAYTISSERDTIEFSIPGFGVQTIRPLSPLPAIDDPVLIDGYTQPGASPNIALMGDDGVLLIELDGSLAGITYGLRLQGGDSIVRGLVINRFGTGAALFDQVGGIQISARGGNRIEGNFIGTDPTGMLDRGNFVVGIFIIGASNHVIGGISPEQRNVISGTEPIISGTLIRPGNGILLDTLTAGNRIEGNLIGTAADGVTALGNAGFGIDYNAGMAATNTVIGGTLPGSGNVIAFNGILLVDNSSLAEGGGIDAGANAPGTAILGNSIHSNFGLGIRGDLINAPEGRRNFPFLSAALSSNGVTTIQGRLHSVSNALHRIEFFANDTLDPSSHGEGQFFLGATNVPTDSNGFVAFTAVLPVAVSNGMFLTATATDDRNSTSEFSPRLTMGDVLTNVIVVNSINEVDDGVANTNHTSLREAIVAANNHTGPDTIRFAIGTGAKTIAVSNSQPALMDAATTLDATTQPGFAGQPLIYLDGLGLVPTGFRLYSPSNTIRGFAINRFGTGIYGDGTYCSPSGGFNVIEGNYIGTDRTGGSTGFQIRGITFLLPGCSSNRIGGTLVAARNVISGNTASTGVGVTIGESAGNTIQGNFIGIGLTGSNVVFNRHGIILSGSKGSTIGGSTPGARNIISGNNERQIYLAGCPGSVVQGNFIGTDVLGRTHLANCITALMVESDGILIRSNLISGPTATGGVYLGGSSNRVEGNFIGTDAAGTNAIQSNLGVMIAGRSGNVIGGTNAASRNLIAGGSHGVIIQGQANVVQGNFIGTKIDGVSPLGHFFEGVIVQGSLNQIGGVGAGMGNTISFNGGAGISVSAGTDNAVLGNSIFSNTGLGIDLGTTGVTTNDFGDLDAGANNLQNFPILSAARNIGASTLLEGTLNSRSNTSFRIEFFSNTNCHSSGFGQGRTFLNSTTATTDPSGNATFSFNYPVPIPAGQFITATATDPNNNTSEFSPCVNVINDTNYVVLSFSTFNPYTLSWPTSALNFSLERATNLTPPVVWQIISNGITTNGGNKVFVVTNDPALPTLFFRLKRP